jgi:putative MFS transporter
MYGRRNCYFVSTAVIALFGLLCTASQNIETLIALRFVVGLGLGGVTCSFTLLSEVVGKAHRGKKIILSMGLLWTAGCILAAVTAWICFTLIPSIDWQWKAYVILAAVPSLILLTMFPWMIESPRFHLKAKNEQKAIQTLRAMALKNKMQPAFPDNLRLKSLPEEVSKAEQWKTLFNKKYRLSTLILTGLWFLNMGAYYGICFVTPLYFKALHDNEYLAAFISSCSEVPGILAASWLVDHWGRKHTLMIMYSICFIFTVLMGLSAYLPFPALVVMAVFSRGSAMGAIMSLYLYTPEVYPTHARNLALGLGSAVSRVSGIITSYLSFSSASAPMASTAIFIYAGAVLICDVITFFLPFETKDKLLDGGFSAKECNSSSKKDAAL